MSARHEMRFGLAVCLLCALPVHAEDLSGAWANDLSVCAKIFVKRNNRVSFADNADFYGSGFIINGKDFKGKLGKCRVTNRKVQGANIQIFAECATEMAFLSDQFNLRVDAPDKITRFYPSMPGMEMIYYRCPR
jgi:hypothetical protein